MKNKYKQPPEVLIDKFKRTANMALQLKEPEDLTSDEKVAIAILSGVPFKQQTLPGGDVGFVTQPCVLSKDEDTGQWSIAHKDHKNWRRADGEAFQYQPEEVEQ